MWFKNNLKSKRRGKAEIVNSSVSAVKESPFTKFSSYEDVQKRSTSNNQGMKLPRKLGINNGASDELGDAVKSIMESVTSTSVNAGESYRYEILNKIGEGGTASVFRTIDKKLKREVALKRFNNKTNIMSSDSEYLKELKVITRLDHPNIVSTYDMGSDRAGDFIVMSLIQGIDLEEHLGGELLDKVTFKEFALQILEGCSEMHSKQVLHLDLKPSNIMVFIRPSGRILAKIIDFGSAKIKNTKEANGLAGERSMKGSIHFMSPEDMNKEKLDERSDIYSLGCVFYQALSGERPFKGETSIMVMASHLQNRYTPLDELITNVPKELITLIHQMISFNPNDRPSSAGEVLRRVNEMKW